MTGKIPQYEDEIVFRIPKSQSARLRQWISEIDTKVATNQIETGKDFAGNELHSHTILHIRKSIERGEPLPYYGVSDGAYEYSFVPTSIGIVIKVKNLVSGDIIDLTDYEDW